MSPSSDESGIDRRDVLCSGGSAIFGSLVAALLGGRQSRATCRRSTELPFV